MALKRGTATAPSWVRTLEAAQAWGKPPWEISWRPGPVVWMLRFHAYREASIEAEKEAIKKMKNG